MKKIFVLLFAVLITAGVKAEDLTYTLSPSTYVSSFTNTNGGGVNTFTDNNVEWTATLGELTGSAYIISKNGYLRVGKSTSQYYSSITFSTDYFKGYKVKSVVVNIKGNNQTIAMKVTSGTNEETTSGVIKNDKFYDLTVESEMTGSSLDIELSQSTSCTYMMITTITITYEESQGQTITISPSGYSSFGASVAYKVPDGLTAYTGTIGESSVSLTKIEDGIIPANTGVILQGTANTDYVLEETTTEKVVENNDLIAVTESAVQGDGSTIYALSYDAADDYKPFFGPVGAAYSVPVGKAYYVLAGNAKKMDIVFSDATGVTMTKSLNVKSSVPYNVAGQQVSSDYKGIIIMKGKKFVNK